MPTGGAEALDLVEALGRFVVRDYRATVASPPFDNSAMDGYAVRAADAGREGAELRVIGEQPAGRDLGLMVGEGEAVRIFTGAPLPGGATAVIMQEDVTVIDGGSGEAGGAVIRVDDPVSEGEFIRRAGADLCAGQVIAAPGTRLTPQRIGLLASQGLTSVEVRPAPRLAVITTGDEVVLPEGDQALEPGEIYNSNGPMLEALARRAGAIVVSRRHAVDRPDALENVIDAALEEADLLVFAGGVSVGERDLVKASLETRGIGADFWKVRLKPGKPFLFGHREDRLVFGLPGNPASAFVTFMVFVVPAIHRWLGAPEDEPASIECELGEDLANPGDRPHYLRGEVDHVKNTFHSLGMQQSHALAGLARANALLRLEAGESRAKGERARVLVV